MKKAREANYKITRRQQAVLNLQSRISRRYMDIQGPSNYSARSTINTILPPTYPRSADEVKIMKQIPAVFNVRTPVKVERLEYLTRHHPNWPFIDYILEGF